MKIVRIDTFHVRPRWLFVKVVCDDGTYGWGEATLEGRSQTVETAVRELSRYLIGEDPRDIERHWQHMYRGTFYRNGPVLCSAISGIDQALWDILGKHLKAPVWRLLGGKVRNKIRLYGWIPGETTGDYIEKYSKEITENKEGFTAYKMCPVPAMQMIENSTITDGVVEMFRKVREKVEKKIDIGVDFHGRCTPAMSKKLAHLLEPFQPYFIEEPVLPGDTAALKEITRSTSIPIATGERLFTRWQFQDLIEQQAVAILQPDLSHCGGISEARKIASAAESRNIAIAPHCPLGPIALSACLQFAAATPNFLCQEHLTLGVDYLKDPYVVKEGYIEINEKPGLGIDIDEDKLKKGLFAGDWETPVFHLKDGSFTEW